MKKLILVGFLMVTGHVVGGDEFISFGNGKLIWTNDNANSIQTIEWCSNIEKGRWQSNWHSLRGLSPKKGECSVAVPMFFRLRSETIRTGLPSNAEVVRCTTNSEKLAYADLKTAYADAVEGDLIYVQPGVYDVGYFGIEKPDIAFIGPYPPQYSVESNDFVNGVIFSGNTRLYARNLSFINIGFKDYSGGDPVHASSGHSTNNVNLFMQGCVFGGTFSNSHNLLIIGKDVEMYNCSSFNGGHNFAFKTTDLDLHDIYSYNGRITGIIIKGSSMRGDCKNSKLSNILLEGPSQTNTADGMTIEAYGPESKVSNVSIHSLVTKHVEKAVYIWPHEGAEVCDVRINKCESYNSYGGYGDYIFQSGCSEIDLTGCRSYSSNGSSFVNYGSGKVRLIQCHSDKTEGQQTSGHFPLRT